MADTPQQAEARRQLRARGEQLAPRTGTSGRSAAGADTAEAITGVPVRRATQRRPSSTARRPSSTTTRARGRRAGVPPRRGDGGDLGQGGDGGRPGAFQQGGAVERTAVRQFRATSRVLVVEFVLCLLLVALKPKEPASPDKASEAVVPQFVAVAFVFLLLAAVGAVSPRAQRVSNLFGALVMLALVVKNHSNIASAVVSVTGAQTPAAPDMAPEVGNAPGQVLPTPTGTSADLGIAQQVVSGWRGSAPEATGTTQAAGTTTAGGRG